MRRLAHRVLLFLLLLTVAGEAVSQTTYPLLNHDTLWVYNCHGDNISFSYPADYVTDSLDTYVVVETAGAPFSVNITLYQNSWSGSSLANLQIWDGDPANGILLANSSSNNFSGNIYVSSGRLVAHLERADSIGFIYLMFTVGWDSNQSFTSSCIYNIQNLHVSNLTHNSAQLQWDGGAFAYYKVSYGDVTQTVLGNEITLQNLTADSEYTVSVLPTSDFSRPCCARTITFRTNCTPHIGCPDFTDLHSGSVRGYYGSFFNPYESVGFIETSDPFFSPPRHAVHTDTAETDLCTGGQLHTVCPGTPASIQLGNWNNGAEAEAIEYSLYVDTNLYALLLLRYAVVLQNPDHTAAAQPHFQMEVLDNNGVVIDPYCGTVDFAASSSLGWNEDYYNGPLVWKDWTTLGFDMTPYHGQIVRVRFTTRDCSIGAHFGYAYFSAECSLNSATTQYCGETDTNTLTAPDGFNYLWYYDLNNPISTNQTVYFSNNDAMLHCRLISRDNPNCYVTLNTYAGHRWPLAIIDTLQTESLGCEGHRVYFLNRSVITNDNGDTVDRHCESARWDFGDGHTSSDYSPQHVYRDSGDYTVTLIAGIANNSCADTTSYIIHIPDYYIPAFKDTFACDTLWIDSLAFTYDTLGPQFRVNHPNGCDTLYTLDLHILNSPVVEMPTDTFCYSDTYFWRGQFAGNHNITDTARYRLTSLLGPAANGCDSLLVLNLVQIPPDHISIASESDCDNKKYHLTAVTDLPYLRWSSVPHDTCLDGHESDRSIFVAPASRTIYTVTTDHLDTLYCPSSLSLALSPVAFPNAKVSVSPLILTHDHAEFDAYDVSRLFGPRWWGVQTFPGSNDTLFLSETSVHLHYRLDEYLSPESIIDLDSVRVILASSNDICYDTTHVTLPFVKVMIWAPNVFTPSEDVNNRFALVASDIQAAELYLYDRAGRLVFSTHDLAQGWDGTYNGRPCSQGAYVWLLRYRSAEYPDTWQTTSGTVTLLR